MNPIEPKNGAIHGKKTHTYKSEKTIKGSTKNKGENKHHTSFPHY